MIPPGRPNGSAASKEAAPPRWAEGALRRLLPPGDAEIVAGDLLEHYRESVLPRRGGRLADLWYLRQVASLALRVLVGTKEGQIGDGWIGAALGIALSAIIVLTNVVLPMAGIEVPDRGSADAIFFGSLSFAFAVAGFLAYRRKGAIRGALRAGAIAAFLSILFTLATFFVVDNLFLDLVSRQPEKIWSFRHSHDASMRAHINRGLARGVVLALPILTVLGGLCGSLGGVVGNLFASRPERKA